MGTTRSYSLMSPSPGGLVTAGMVTTQCPTHPSGESPSAVRNSTCPTGGGNLPEPSLCVEVRDADADGDDLHLQVVGVGGEQLGEVGLAGVARPGEGDGRARRADRPAAAGWGERAA